MILHTKPYTFHFDIVNYQYEYNPKGFTSDNNWLITSVELVDVQI